MDSSAAGGFLAVLGVLLFFYFVVLAAVYVLGSLATYKLYKKAGVNHAWMAWVPVLNAWPYFWVIGKSSWNILWGFVPIVNIIFAIIWQVKFLNAFGFSGHWLWFTLLPGVGGLILFIQHIYMGLSKHVQFVGTRTKYHFTDSTFTA